MTSVALPAIWLIVLIVGLPQLSETVYTPSLPAIVDALNTTQPMVEYTLTIYLFAFALGTLFWGRCSDKLGRKPCVCIGFVVFIIGCIGCYSATSIEMLLLSRFIQAFGGSTGSVMGQAICRDAYRGQDLGRVYSAVGSALALFPALGPVCGGFIAEHWGWAHNFIFLLLFALVLLCIIIRILPETHHQRGAHEYTLTQLAWTLMRDKRVMAFGFIVAACNGIVFSYFAEGSYYLIEVLGLSPSDYGLSFIIIALCMMMGGILSRYLHRYHTSQTIMGYGVAIAVGATALFSTIAFWYHLSSFASVWMIAATIICHMICCFGICMITSNALASALSDYKHVIGSATSLFGCYYYTLISAFTLGMAVLHNGTLLPMPLYFLGIALMMMFVDKRILSS